MTTKLASQKNYFNCQNLFFKFSISFKGVKIKLMIIMKKYAYDSATLLSTRLI